MPRAKRLQVFVSSTYTDLREERQAAVEAILTAGHIPAGMELFTAGDQSQMAVIRQWIDASDVFLLVLGGRYGSIEPTSRKSYTHLEYDYAVERGKPLFAVVVTEEHLDKKVKKVGKQALETGDPQKLRDFRALVQTRMVRFWSDPRDIKLAIHETLAEFGRRPELVGWVRGDEAANAAALADELARLTKENAQLREQLARSSGPAMAYHGLTFEQMCQLLAAEQVPPTTDPEVRSPLYDVARLFGDREPTLLHVVWVYGERLAEGSYTNRLADRLLEQLVRLGLATTNPQGDEYGLTPDGLRFSLRLKLDRGTEAARQLIE
jgi:hypothetical protein